MAKLNTNGHIRIGHVYECIFGLFKRLQPDEAGNLTTVNKDEADSTAYDYRIPVELVKKRAVVVIGKHKGQYIVVPISSTQATDKKPHKYPESMGTHIRLTECDLPQRGKYSEFKPRWAKCDLVTTVDGGRLRDIFDTEAHAHVPAHAVTSNTLLEIRYGVMRAIGLRDLVPSSDDES